MGLFSEIGDFVSDAVGTVGDIFNPVSGLIGAAGSFFGQTAANEANREISNSQMAFQERMSNTAYQRSMDDMRLAGLNPILAYKTGGASTPSGAAIAMQNAAGGAASSFQSATNSAIGIKKLKTEVDLLQAQERRERTQGTQNQALTTKLIKEGEILRQQLKLLKSIVPYQLQQNKFKSESPNLNKWRAFWDLTGNASSANQLWQIPLKRGLK